MTRTAGIYVRISLDPNGTRLGVTRQTKDCHTKAHQLGWNVHGIYEDNDTSATSTKPRPAYQRMLTDLEHGAINAVIVWDLDRLTRRPIEIEQFIDLADRRRIALASVGGDVDLATDNGRLFARIKGAVARAEIERKSARMRAANIQRAEQGAPETTGRRLFGYARDGATIVQPEAAAIRSAAEQLLAGAPLRTLARDLNTAGHTTTTGRPWEPTQLRRSLQNPRYAGLRAHLGTVVAHGQWPAILDLDTHRAVTAVLTDPSRHKAGRPQGALLTSIATCGVCDAGVYSTRSGPRPRLYYCSSRTHVGRAADPVDEYVTAALLAYLGRSARELLTDPSLDTARRRELSAREVTLRGRLDGLAAAYAAGDIDDTQLRSGSRRVRADLDEVVRDLAAAQRAPAMSALVGADDIGSAWAGLGLEQQRAILAAALRVVLHPAGRGSRRFDPDTVTIAASGLVTRPG